MTVQIIRTIEAPAENIWKTIRAYDNVESWNPFVTSSKITGTDEGSERICQVQLGEQRGELVENLDSVDEENKTIQISVTKAPPPFGGLQITFQVKSLDENKTELLISTDVVDSNDTAKGLLDVLQMMAEGLAKLHEEEVNA
jgi:uncharacterized protein YndB with AHSA1/START domain